MGIPFLFTHYVHWKMVAHQNVTPDIPKYFQENKVHPSVQGEKSL